MSAVMLAALVAAAVPLQVIPASSTFSCETMTSHSCSCSRHTPTVFELLCPDQMAVSINLQESINFQCATSNNTFTEPEGLNVGDVNRFILRFCPLPNKSIKEVMTNIGINNIEMLQIQSYGDLGDTLKKEHFENLDNVTQLSLNSNGLTSLPVDIFKSMRSLTWLDMKFNRIGDYPKEIFYFTPKLEVLELGKNNLTRLRPGIFMNLDRLRLLNLWGNNLNNLSRAVFSDVPNLEALDLNSNNMDFIRPDLFADLIKLKKLNLFSNRFTSLPQGLLSRNFDLEEFQMHENIKTITSLPSGFFSNLYKLSMIKLSGSKIKHLPNDTFSGSTKIERIDLSRNYLETIEKNTFNDLQSLEYLDLSKNRISHLPEDLFMYTKNLKTLLLNSNELSTIPPNLFIQLRKVEVIDLRFNMIREIESPQFDNQQSLKSLNISDNQLTSLALKKPDDQPSKSRDISDNQPNMQIAEYTYYSALHRCTSLEDLQLANNSLQEIYEDWKLILNRLHTLNLNHNKFEKIEANDLEFISISDLLIDLSNNNITMVDFRNAQLLALGHVLNFNSTYERDENTKTKQIKLDNNPLNCNCNLLHFVQFVRGEVSPEVQYLFNIPSANLRCHQPAALENLPLIRVHPISLTCQIPDSDHYVCPKGCKCFYRVLDKANVIDCQGSGLPELPSHIPHYPQKITNHSLLFFQDNRLKSFELPVGKGFDDVTHFYLSNNNMTTFNISGVSDKIEVLDLSNNKLKIIQEDAISFLDAAQKLNRLELQGNPWQCDCEAKPLISLVKKRFKQVSHLTNITCSDGHQLQDVDESELCFDYLLLVCIILAVVGFLIAILTGLYYRYYTAIHIYCFSSKWKFLRWLVSHPDHDHEKKYDAFISFSHDDEQFVSEILVPALEQNGERKYKLCLHYRDWTPGEMITTQVIESIQSSRRTVVVLSPGFIKSVWGAMEFKTAHAEALRSGKSKVVAILYKDIGPLKNLDEELKTYLQLNTYVKWGSPWFWQQLHYSLPHPNEDAEDLQCAFGCYPRFKKESRSQIVRNIHLNEKEMNLHNLSQNSEKVNEKGSNSSSTPLIIDDKEEKTKEDLAKNQHKENVAVCV